VAGVDVAGMRHNHSNRGTRNERAIDETLDHGGKRGGIVWIKAPRDSGGTNWNQLGDPINVQFSSEENAVFVFPLG